MRELMIIRHARSLYNVEDSKNLDDGLTDYGHQQANMVGEFLRNEFKEGYWNIVTSPFLRCLLTASHIQDHLHCNVTVDGRLGEMTVDYHTLDSLHVAERKEKFPDADFSGFDHKDFAHERCEHYVQRLNDVYHDVPNRSILVTHGSPVLSFIRMHEHGEYSSVPIWNHSVDNCSMTWIRGERMIWRSRNLYWELPDKVWACGV